MSIAEKTEPLPLPVAWSWLGTVLSDKIENQIAKQLQIVRKQNQVAEYSVGEDELEVVAV